MNWTEDFKDNILYRIEESVRMIGIALAKVDEQFIWQRPNAVSNSIGNQLLHLCGNLTQYIQAGIGGEPDRRQRDLEFSADEGYDKDELLNRFLLVVKDAKKIIKNCAEEELLKMREIQGFKMSGMGALIHAVEHLSYHTGQIAFWVKELNDEPLEFYGGIDLNKTKDITVEGEDLG